MYLITDVFVWDNESNTPDDFQSYTGVRNDLITSPFIPNVVGTRLDAIDVNKGIGGETVGIYVKYALVDIHDEEKKNLKVLTGIEVQHWPNWKPPTYSDGWGQANGMVGDTQGSLTAGTDGSCWRNGLAVQYRTLGDAIKNNSNLIMNLFMSITESSSPSYPKFVRANGGVWPMHTAGIDIHKECGDDNYYRLICSHGKNAGAIPEIPDSMKRELMQKFAPYIYMDKEESYYPSTVEFSFQYLERYLNDDGCYWLKTKEELESPSSTLKYFEGNLADAKAYAFWVEKAHDVYEVTYFIYYPYNRGKELINTIWGNHVGDWEHVTVRFGWDFDNGEWLLSPFEVYLSAHSGGNHRAWKDVKLDENSPIVYSARGSHAMYFDPGEHTYSIVLTDHCSDGEVFDCSQNNKIVPFDFATKKGLAGDDWPSWMSSDFKDGGDNPQDPSSGGIFRWGNEKRGCNEGQCRLENGPTGPISKSDVWDPNVLE